MIKLKDLNRWIRFHKLLNKKTQDADLAWLSYKMSYVVPFKPMWFDQYTKRNRTKLLFECESILTKIRKDRLIKEWEMSQFRHQLIVYWMLNETYTTPIITKLYQLILRVCMH